MLIILLIRLKEEAEKRDIRLRLLNIKIATFQLDEKHPTVIYKGKEIGEFDVVIPRIASYMTKYGTAVLRQLEMMYPKAFFMNRSIAITRARDVCVQRSYWLRQNNSSDGFLANATDTDPLIEEIGGMPAIINWRAAHTVMASS